MNQFEIANLQTRVVQIATLARTRNTNTRGKLYCGRHRSRSRDYFNPLDLGWGNPYAHKSTDNCLWQVATLDDCLTNYRLWLWRLIQNANNRDALSDWETMYLYRFLHLCNNLETYHTLVCFCIDRPHRASDSTEIVCHTQILWNAAVWYRLNKI